MMTERNAIIAGIGDYFHRLNDWGEFIIFRENGNITLDMEFSVFDLADSIVAALERGKQE